MYDVANQAYTTVVISFVYSAFFVRFIVPSESAWRDAYWSVALIGSLLATMVLAPWLGNRMDRGWRRKPLLALMTLICSLSTGALFWVDPGEIGLALLLLFLSNAAWMLAESIIASFLPYLASRRNMGVVSGLGWGIGYLGGLISMVVVSLVILSASPETQEALYIRQHQWAMVFVAGYFVLFSLPTFIWLREPPRGAGTHAPAAGQLAGWGLLLRKRALRRFMLAFLFYMAGVQVVIKFIGIFTSAELGMSSAELVQVFLATQVSAMLGALGFGLIERRFGAVPTLMTTIGLWCLAIGCMIGIYPLSAFVGLSPPSFFTIVALLAGTGIGSIQASSRSLVGQIIDPGEDGAAFGIWGAVARCAAILGAGFGVIADLMGRQPALVFVLALFLLGAIFLARYDRT